MVAVGPGVQAVDMEAMGAIGQLKVFVVRGVDVVLADGTTDVARVFHDKKATLHSVSGCLVTGSLSYKKYNELRNSL